MPRPKKRNADYFSHDANMRNNRKIRALRSKYGLAGYGVWCMILESLTEADNLEIGYTEREIELLCGDFGTEKSFLREIVEYCLGLDMIQTDGVKLWSDSLRERLFPVFQKRFLSQKRHEEKNEGEKISVTETNSSDWSDTNSVKPLPETVFKANQEAFEGCSASEKSISVTEIQQTKLKETKLKETKVLKQSKTETGRPAFFSDFESTLFEKFCAEKEYNPELGFQALRITSEAVAKGNVCKAFGFFRACYKELEKKSGDNDWNIVLQIAKASDQEKDLLKKKLSQEGLEAFYEISKYLREMKNDFTVWYSDTGLINVKSEFLRIKRRNR